LGKTIALRFENVRFKKKTSALRFENVKFQTNFAQPCLYSKTRLTVNLGSCNSWTKINCELLLEEPAPLSRKTMKKRSLVRQKMMKSHLLSLGHYKCGDKKYCRFHPPEMNYFWKWFHTLHGLLTKLAK
jgi:hypothetical protein